MYLSTPLVLECVMKSTQRTRIVELGEIDLVGEAGGAPIALLGGVPAMARVVTKRNK